MKPLAAEALDYMHTKPLGVLSIELLDGSPHGATVHFAHCETPFAVYVETKRTSKKCEPLIKNGMARASFVVGVEKEDMRTLQMDGEVRIATAEEEITASQMLCKKFARKALETKDADALFIIFTPTWWRYTDWRMPGQGKVIASD